MKTVIQRLALAVVVFVIFSCIAGCVSVGGPITLKMTRDHVDWEMVHFNNRVAFRGFVTTGEQERVQSAYKAYLAAYDQAVKQANGNLNASTPDDVKQLADQVTKALASIPSPPE